MYDDMFGVYSMFYGFTFLSELKRSAEYNVVCSKGVYVMFTYILQCDLTCSSPALRITLLYAPHQGFGYFMPLISALT